MEVSRWCRFGRGCYPFPRRIQMERFDRQCNEGDVVHRFFTGGRAAMLCCIAASVLISGCTLADQFGERAVAYNIEAESARDQNLLLNVIRAAYRKPMQFTDVSSATGTATATGTVGSSLLVGPHQSAVASTLSPGFTFAGGPTFTMNALDTKEFYSGILAPIDNTLISYFVSVGIPKQVLYTLLFGEIDFDGPRKPLLNSAAKQGDWDDFQTLLNALLAAGLTTELKDPGYFGPRLSAASLRDPAKLAALAKEKLDLVADKPGKSGESAVWHAVKDSPKPRFCFARSSRASYVVVDRVPIEIPSSARCGQTNDTGSDRSDDRPDTLTTKTLLPGLRVRVRSVEGVIYFLGEISRTELGLDVKHPSPVKPWLCFGTIVGGKCTEEPDILFSIRPGYQARSISTSYDSQTYSMPVDPSNDDHSAQVLEFVSQLLALSSSSKDLPSPGVVTLIGH